ncbi:polyvinyl alcohol dehydrogenase (cytochrome) [Catenulispora sp. GP43]|uniref:outer membrane protein assembly factor BamB family protein n=1 Tax=Catenulispora sp. GP43 TaxID=3156263 RepID=UPI003518DC05
MSVARAMGALLALGMAATTASCAAHSTAPAKPSPTAVSPVKLDGPVYGKPADGGTAVFAATENDTVYALSPADGSVMWSKHLAEPFRPHTCGNINPLGITGAPAYDPASHLVYVVAEDADAHHVLYGLSAADGHVVSHVAVDPPVGDRAYLQQRSALTLWHGHVFATFGGLFGDCGTYTGAVASVDAASGSVNWFEASSSGRGGMWAPGAPAIGTDRLYFSIGNGDAVQAGQPYDGTDSVVALDVNAKRVDFFAPASWAQDNGADLDLGSMNPVLAAGHVIIAGKSGQGYLLDPAALGGIGGGTPFQACSAFGAAAADGDVVYLPCADGTRAFRIGDQVTPLWHAAHTNGQPVLAGGLVWAADYDSGVLYALDPATGHAARQIAVGALPHFATPAVVGDKLFLGTAKGVAIIGVRS